MTDPNPPRTIQEIADDLAELGVMPGKIAFEVPLIEVVARTDFWEDEE